MCFFNLWKRTPSSLQTRFVSPIIVISPVVKQQIVNTPILPKNCNYCKGVLYTRGKQYHTECFHTVIFKKEKERKQQLKAETSKPNSF